jgi:hypothetical protein
MDIIKTIPKDPWSYTDQLVDSISRNLRGVLIKGPVGSCLVQFTETIHRMIRHGRPFNVITCSPNFRTMEERIYGPTRYEDEFYPGTKLSASPLVNSLGGTLVLVSPDYCTQEGIAFLKHIIQDGRVLNQGNNEEEDTTVIGLVIEEWSLDVDDPLIHSLFSNQLRVPRLEEIKGQAPAIVTWFVQQERPEIQNLDIEQAAYDYLCTYSWPGDRAEAREFADVISGMYFKGFILYLDTCKNLLETPQSSRFHDQYRKREIERLTKDITFRGQPVSTTHVYNWVAQLSQVSYFTNGPWEIGMVIVREIASHYFFSHDRMDELVTLACEKFKSLYGKTAIHEICLIIPETPLKSSSTITRSIFLTLGGNIKTTTISTLNEILKQGSKISVLIYADDFIGTGNQVYDTIISKTLSTLNDYNFYRQDKISLVLLFGIGYNNAIKSLESKSNDKLNIVTLTGTELNDTDRVFSSSTRIFPVSKLRKKAKRLLCSVIGKHLYPEWPQGYGNSQSLIVLAANTPDNTLPAVSRSGMVRGFNWTALFQRVDT